MSTDQSNIYILADLFLTTPQCSCLSLLFNSHRLIFQKCHHHNKPIYLVADPINYSIDTLEAAIHFRSELILVLIVAFSASFSRRGREIEGFARAENSGNIPPSMGTFLSLVCQYVPLSKILDRSGFG